MIMHDLAELSASAISCYLSSHIKILHPTTCLIHLPQQELVAAAHAMHMHAPEEAGTSQQAAHHL